MPHLLLGHALKQNLCIVLATLHSYYHWKALNEIGVHESGFLMFKTMVQEVLNIE
jgi:hypothetical protein